MALNQMWTLIILFVVLISRSTHCSLNISNLIQEPGDVCNEIETCIEGTVCDQDGLCSCPDPYRQTFDVQTKRCVSKVGENCQSNHDCTRHATCVPQWNSSLGNFNGKCQCIGKHFDLSFERTCGKRSRYGETCVDHINDINYQPCDVNQNLKCVGGLCQCENDLLFVYDVHRKACGIKAGGSCYSNRHNPNICVHGAKCKHYRNVTEGSSMIKSHSASLRCRCDPGFLKTPEGFCFPGFGHPCDLTRPCFNDVKFPEESNLVCLNGRCSCASTLNQYFDAESGLCFNKVNSPCTINQTVCSSYSNCILKDGFATLTCQCNQGFSETLDQRCKLSYQENCSSGGLATRGTTRACNNDVGLACVQNTCACFDSSLQFDLAKQMCVNKLGGFCGTHVDLTSGAKYSVGCKGFAENKCIKNYSGSGNGYPCFCSQDVKVLYPPKQYCDYN